MMSYFSLFISAFLAATLLPISSEIFLASLVLSGKYDLMWLWAWATVGNVTGSMINWVLGRYFIRLVDKSELNKSQSNIDKAKKMFLKYGTWTLLLTWLPVIGDPLSFIAGVFRVPIFLFILLVSLGKGVRYFIVIYLIK
jgi:membrane protein YqaA with SNARE-associated domain